MISSWVVAGTLKRIFGFLFSPAGKFLVVVLAFALWTMYQRADATAACVADYASQEIEEANRQATIATGIAKRARERADRSEAELNELEQSYDALKKDIENGALGSCLMPDDVRDRMLRIK